MTKSREDHHLKFRNVDDSRWLAPYQFIWDVDNKKAETLYVCIGE